MGACERRCELRLGEAGYPSCIARLASPPKRLYIRGDPGVLGAPALAIIGSRRATPYGLALVEMAARVAVESGLVVVSGGARGCDQAAGLAALDAGGRHVVVLGTGADVVYPSTSAPLIERALATGGAVVSIEPWGTQPMRWAFPKRNRVIAALAEALFVSEAGMPSGTFSTAEAAMELNHEVLVAPGSILSPESRGSNYLIGMGACCIADVEALEVAISRIYGTLRYCRAPASATGADAGTARERRLIEMLTANPMRDAEIAEALGLDAIACMRMLSALEMRGEVERLVDGRFSPTRRALHARGGLGQNGGRAM